MDPTLIEHQIVEAEAELFISGVFDRRPTGTPSFFSKLFNCNRLQRFRQGSKLDADSHTRAAVSSDTPLAKAGSRIFQVEPRSRYAYADGMPVRSFPRR
jgi:hypothetical protein